MDGGKKSFMDWLQQSKSLKNRKKGILTEVHKRKRIHRRTEFICDRKIGKTDGKNKILRAIQLSKKISKSPWIKLYTK